MPGVHDGLAMDGSVIWMEWSVVMDRSSGSPVQDWPPGKGWHCRPGFQPPLPSPFLHSLPGQGSVFHWDFLALRGFRISVIQNLCMLLCCSALPAASTKLPVLPFSSLPTYSWPLGWFLFTTFATAHTAPGTNMFGFISPHTLPGLPAILLPHITHTFCMAGMFASPCLPA